MPTTASSFFKGTCTRGIYESLGTPPPQDNLWVFGGIGCANLSGLCSSDHAPGVDGTCRRPQPVPQNPRLSAPSRFNRVAILRYIQGAWILGQERGLSAGGPTGWRLAA